jgi:hypothetical protein
MILYMNFPLILDEIDILQSSLLQLIGFNFSFLVDFPVVSAPLHVVGPDDLVVSASQNVFHQDQMISSLDFVPVEGKKTIDLG